MTVLEWIVGALLCAFTARRCLFWFAALLPRQPGRPARSRSITVLVAAHNEARKLPQLFAAFDRLDYSRHLLSYVLVDDGSTDTTATSLTDWVENQAQAKLIVLPQRSGKAAALQVALAAAAPSDLIAVIDADAVPAPDALGFLAGAFEDNRVGAACGFPDPGVAHRSIVGRYAALERWVSHLVTFAGKDRLGLQPPVIGAICCIRRRALEAMGGFPQGTMAEDIHLSLDFSHAGWKTRWLREAVAREDVPEDIQGFRLQRLRWSRGLLSSTRRSRGLEEGFAAIGYLDRLAFATGMILTLFADFPLWLPLAYVAAPVVMIFTALLKADPPNKLLYVFSVLPMVWVDFAITLESAIAQILGTRLIWASRKRRSPG